MYAEVHREPGDSVDQVHAAVMEALQAQAEEGVVHVQGDVQERHEATVEAVLDELTRAAAKPHFWWRP